MVQLEDSGDSQELIRSATHQLMFTDSSLAFSMRAYINESYMPDSANTFYWAPTERLLETPHCSPPSVMLSADSAEQVFELLLIDNH